MAPLTASVFDDLLELELGKRVVEHLEWELLGYGPLFDLAADLFFSNVPGPSPRTL